MGTGSPPRGPHPEHGLPRPPGGTHEGPAVGHDDEAPTREWIPGGHVHPAARVPRGGHDPRAPADAADAMGAPDDPARLLPREEGRLLHGVLVDARLEYDDPPCRQDLWGVRELPLGGDGGRTRGLRRGNLPYQGGERERRGRREPLPRATQDP